MKRINELIFFLVLFCCISGIFQNYPIFLKNLEINTRTLNNDIDNLNKFQDLHIGNSIYSSYNLSVELDNLTSTLEGKLEVDFYNNDQVNFSKLPFHIYLSGMNFTSRPGKIDIIDVNKSDKTPLVYEVYPQNQTMWIHLDTKLEPLQRTLFDIYFNATLPDGGIDRSNSHGNNYDQSRIYKCAGFYPMPCVYDIYDGWNTDPYLHIGDPFYFDMAYYDFYITVPNGMVVAATGKLIEKVSDGFLTTYYFNPNHPVREVTFSASTWFYVESTLVNGVNVSTYYLPKSQFIWENNALIYAIQALTLFNDTFGEYPYPTLNIVEEYTYFGGMEYPCQVYITESIDYWSNPQYWLELIIAHEVSHQWWYNLIGNDEVDWGFLDEGLAVWSESYYAEIFYGNWIYFQYPPWIDEVRNYYAVTGLPSKINASVYNAVNADNYYYTAYTKAPLIIEQLRRNIGNASFIDGLKYYYNQKVYKIAMLSDLQLSMETVYGKSLDWFFFPWFDNFYLPKYNFISCTYDMKQKVLKLTINDLNEPLNPYSYSQQVPLSLYDKNNNMIFNDIFWINGTTSLQISITNTPNKVRLIYTDDVLVQLDSPSKLYIESPVETVGFQNPGSFTLSSDADDPDTDGAFNLIWTDSDGADNYSIYLHNSKITEINETLTTVVSQTAVSPFSITGLSSGDYYYIIVAYNETGQTMSNCIHITVKKGGADRGIPGYNSALLIGVLFAISILIYKKVNELIKNS
ncbi:MAG: M1 family metallopeptidase [Promethearchaeota archaeon]